MHILGDHVTDEYIDNLIKDVDVNGDGEISFDEFFACFRSRNIENGTFC